MGRNGKKMPSFSQMVAVINSSDNNIISKHDVLLGNPLDYSNSVTNYLYKLIKLKYLEPIFSEGASNLKNVEHFKICRAIPVGYTSVVMDDELRLLNGKKPKYARSLLIICS